MESDDAPLTPVEQLIVAVLIDVFARELRTRPTLVAEPEADEQEPANAT